MKSSRWRARANASAKGNAPAPLAPAEPTMFCRQCRYILDGLPANRCPECGTGFDPLQAETYLTSPKAKLPVPWECTVASGLTFAIYALGFFMGEMQEDRVLVPIIGLFAFSLILAISGIRRKGYYRRRSGWVVLVALLPWVVVFAAGICQEVSSGLHTNWYAFRRFWGLHP
jgi:hypothetical protein